MKRRAFLLIGLICVSLFAFDFGFSKGYKDIDAKTAWNLVKKGALFIDVRTTNEYKRAHAKGAKLVPLYDEIDGKIEPNNNLIKKIEYLANDDYDRAIVVICRSGHRSSKVASMLVKAGFSKVYNVVGGFLTRGGWLDYRLPVEK